MNLLQQLATAPRIPSRPIVEHPMPDHVRPLRVALENLADVVQGRLHRIDMRIFIGAAVWIVAIAAGRRFDRVRAMALPVEEDAGDSAIDHRDAGGVECLLQRTPGRRRSAVENRRGDALSCRRRRTLGRVDTEANDRMRLQGRLQHGVTAGCRNGGCGELYRAAARDCKRAR